MKRVNEFLGVISGDVEREKGSWFGECLLYAFAGLGTSDKCETQGSRNLRNGRKKLVALGNQRMDVRLVL